MNVSKCVLENKRLPITKDTKLEEVLEKYEGALVGLEKPEYMPAKYRGRLWHLDTTNDKEHTIRKYYVDLGEDSLPIEIGDTLILKGLPTG